MESSIENYSHRNVRHYLLACFDTCDVCRVVDRSKVSVRAACCQNFLVNENRRSEVFSAVYHSVAYSADLAEILYAADLRISDSLYDKLYACSVVSQWNCLFDLVTACLSISESRCIS